MTGLFLTPYCFIPPKSGNQNLIYNFLLFISSRITCDVIALSDSEEEGQRFLIAAANTMPNLRTVTVIQKPRRTAQLLARARFALRLFHPALGRYWNPKLASWLLQHAREYDFVHFDMVHMAPYRQFCAGLPCALVASDAYSMAARVAREQGPVGFGAISLWVQELLFRRFERSEYRRFSIVWSVAPKDTACLSSAAPNARIETLPIAVGDQFLSSPPPVTLAGDHRAALGVLCTGALSVAVPGNQVLEFLRTLERRSLTSPYRARATVLGRNPITKLKRYCRTTDSIRPISYVADYLAFLRQDWVYVYPQQCSSGLQTKVQEAMAIGLPVVGFENAFAGLNVTDQIHCLVCRSYDELAEAVLTLINDAGLRAKIGICAQEHIRQNFTKEHIGKTALSRYSEITTHMLRGSKTT